MVEGIGYACFLITYLHLFRHTLCHFLFWFIKVIGFIRQTAVNRLIGITPPRQRPGRTLGLNLDCTQVSLSRRMCHGHKGCQHLFIARVLIASTFPLTTSLITFNPLLRSER